MPPAASGYRLVDYNPTRPTTAEGARIEQSILRTLDPITRKYLRNGLTRAEHMRGRLFAVDITAPDDWAPLSPLNGFIDAGAPSYGNLAVRKDAGGNVTLRSIVQRAAGAPAAFTTILQLPAAYLPATGERRTGEATGNALSGWDITPTGAVRWLFGAPTAYFTLSGTWTAADRSPPAWAIPQSFALGNDFPAAPALVEVLDVLAADGRRQVPAGVAWRPVRRGSLYSVQLDYVAGLTPGQAYTLTVFVTPE